MNKKILLGLSLLTTISTTAKSGGYIAFRANAVDTNIMKIQGFYTNNKWDEIPRIKDNVFGGTFAIGYDPTIQDETSLTIRGEVAFDYNNNLVVYPEKSTKPDDKFTFYNDLLLTNVYLNIPLKQIPLVPYIMITSGVGLVKSVKEYTDGTKTVIKDTGIIPNFVSGFGIGLNAKLTKYTQFDAGWKYTRFAKYEFNKGEEYFKPSINTFSVGLRIDM